MGLSEAMKDLNQLKTFGEPKFMYHIQNIARYSWVDENLISQLLQTFEHGAKHSVQTRIVVIALVRYLLKSAQKNARMASILLQTLLEQENHILLPHEQKLLEGLKVGGSPGEEEGSSNIQPTDPLYQNNLEGSNIRRRKTNTRKYTRLIPE